LNNSIKNLILDQSNDYKNSIKQNIDWYEDNYKSKESLEVYKIKRTDNLLNGKIYRFMYIPDNKVDLKYYDPNPTIISLGVVKFQDSICDLGLNLNYFPFRIRAYIIYTIFKFYKHEINEQIKRHPLNAKMQKYIFLTYDDLISMFPKLNMKFAVRNYYKEKRFKTACISYENLHRVPYIENTEIKKKTIEKVLSEYKKEILEENNRKKNI
jgi:hypothetical protein